MSGTVEGDDYHEVAPDIVGEVAEIRVRAKDGSHQKIHFWVDARLPFRVGDLIEGEMRCDGEDDKRCDGAWSVRGEPVLAIGSGEGEPNAGWRATFREPAPGGAGVVALAYGADRFDVGLGGCHEVRVGGATWFAAAVSGKDRGMARFSVQRAR